MGFFDDIARTRAKGAELIRGPRRRTNPAKGAEEKSRNDATVPHLLAAPKAEEARLPLPPPALARSRPSTRTRMPRERWNEGRRGKLTYLAIGLVAGALTVAWIRSEALRKARISLARAFLPDDLDVRPIDSKAETKAADPTPRRTELRPDPIEPRPPAPPSLPIAPSPTSTAPTSAAPTSTPPTGVRPQAPPEQAATPPRKPIHPVPTKAAPQPLLLDDGAGKTTVPTRL